MKNIFKILILITMHTLIYGQEKKDSLIDISKIKKTESSFINKEIKEKYVEIIFLDNKKMIKAINDIDICNECIRDGEYWYLDYSKKDYVMLSRSRLQNKVKLLNDNVNFFLTIIDKNIIFIYGKNLKQFTKTGFKVDISHLVKLPPIFIEESSFWLLKENGDEIEVILKKTYKCK